jgi:excisionase family DNA binding protein
MEVPMDSHDDSARDRPIDKMLLRPDEVAALLDVPVRTIYRWRSQHAGPRGFRLGRHVRYRLEDVERWLESHRDPQ